MTHPPLPIEAAGPRPRLMVVVDTEEAFDWSRPHSRSAIDVSHIRHQERAQRLFDRCGLRPTYVVDYAVASQEPGFRPLREFLEDGRCVVGAHLHPWVNPPFVEEVSVRNSYPGNLPAALEQEKLAVLTTTIEENFGRRPTIYRAGRYGIGPATGAALEALGYEIDTSVVPRTDFRLDEGPDFSAYDVTPFWFGPARRVLEIPLTASWCGRLRGYGARLQPWLMSTKGRQYHLPGVFARLGLFERIRLTPEGVSFAELQRLTVTLLRAGQRHFVFSYHSPSLAPGNTPYVRDDRQLHAFLATIEEYCDWFLRDCGGVATTPQDYLALFRPSASHPTVTHGLAAEA